MIRRGVLRAATVTALLTVAVVPGPGAAQDTEVGGRVESVVELSLTRASAQRVQATVSATIPDTALTVSEAGRPTRALRTYRGPVTNGRVTVDADVSRTGVTYRTFTFGPQTP